MPLSLAREFSLAGPIFERSRFGRVDGIGLFIFNALLLHTVAAVQTRPLYATRHGGIPCDCLP